MYGDGSSPYSGLGRDLHRIAPSVHEFVQRSTTAMWGAKHDTWNPRGVLQEAMEADGKAFEKRTVDMFRSAVYHAVCFTYVTRELMHVQPTHAFGLSLGEAATYFAFDEANSKQSDAVLARRASSHPPSPSPHTVLHPSHLSHPSHPSRPCALSFVPSPPPTPPCSPHTPAHTRAPPLARRASTPRPCGPRRSPTPTATARASRRCCATSRQSTSGGARRCSRATCSGSFGLHSRRRRLQLHRPLQLRRHLHQLRQRRLARSSHR